MVIIMTLWIGNGAVLISSSQWELKEFWKLNNSGHESFIFKTKFFIFIIYYDITWDRVGPVQMVFASPFHYVYKGQRCL